jgi:2-polyprenyl-3-methyl-5-hydroxy-6-metoxy-1,4-benzoquinol methylase
VLDIGCGIGIVARILVDMNRRISVDAVDFSEMIQVARAENLADRINYFESSAEDYYDPNKRYGLIVSSACFSAIRDVQKMEQAVRNCCRMLSPNSGVLLMIDPFHSWNYLARVKYSSKQMIDFVEQQGLELIRKDGVLFWPFRDWLANSRYQGAQMKSRFMLGERLLSVFGRHTWADYKILIFRRG